MKKFVLLLACLSFSVYFLPAQNPDDVPFNGLITDANGKGVRARITIKSTREHTISNKKGQFGLTNIAGNDTLIFSVKHDRLEIPVANRRSLKVVWIDAEPLVCEDELLVNDGFSYIKRREYTSSTSGFTGEEMIRRGYTDLQSAILNMFAGVRLVNSEITIRGVGSFNSSNGALILCDGMEVRNLNSINIHDVASVEVQKGSNMYGVRGGNGVILISTQHR